MNLKQAVVRWLLEKEKADYHHGVMLLMKAGAPSFGLQDESEANRIKVRRTLQDRLRRNALNVEVLAKTVQTISVQKAPISHEEDLGDMVEMGDEAKLQIDKRSLARERMKLSNAFHDCNSNSERKRVYDKLKSVEDAIQEQGRKIAYFKKTGKALDDVVDIPATTLPDDPVELMKIRNNLRSNISKKLKIMDQFPKNHPRSIKAHTQYVDFDKKLKEVETKINKR